MGEGVESRRILCVAAVARRVRGIFPARRPAVGMAEADWSGVGGVSAVTFRGPHCHPGCTAEGALWIHPTSSCRPMPPHWPLYIGARSEIRPGAFVRGNLNRGRRLRDWPRRRDQEHAHDGPRSCAAPTVHRRLDPGERRAPGRRRCALKSPARSKERLRAAPGRIGRQRRRKFGAILGDGAEVGCNSVLTRGPCSVRARWSLRRLRLAAICRPGRSAGALHHRFRAATGLAPLAGTHGHTDGGRALMAELIMPVGRSLATDLSPASGLPPPAYRTVRERPRELPAIAAFG